jgi:hypothetical protein
MISYAINKKIDGQQLLNDIQKLIGQKVSKDQESVLVIDIKNISYTTNELIPKITHEPS